MTSRKGNSMHTPERRTPPIARVSEGMEVIDGAGEVVGVVKLVRMGDQQAVTTEGQGGGGELSDAIAGLVGGTEPDVPGQFAARLLRSGYLKIDCSGFLTGDVYAPADEIAEVRGSTVQLTSYRHSLVKES